MAQALALPRGDAREGQDIASAEASTREPADGELAEGVFVVCVLTFGTRVGTASAVALVMPAVPGGDAALEGGPSVGEPVFALALPPFGLPADALASPAVAPVGDGAAG